MTGLRDVSVIMDTNDLRRANRNPELRKHLALLYVKKTRFYDGMPRPHVDNWRPRRWPYEEDLAP